MSEQEGPGRSTDRPELPIERGFPIERINEIARREGRAKRWYRPIYTMHNWWARRPGCLFRAMTLYALLDEDVARDEVAVCDAGEDRPRADGPDEADLLAAAESVSMADPESLWEFYPRDVRIADRKVLDPFAGGGTSLVEASRFGVESVGVDLNPVAWFVTNAELRASRVDVAELQAAFERVEAEVAEEIRAYYRTPCPNAAASETRPADGDGVDDDHRADVLYDFWVKELDCVSCGRSVSLFKDYRIADERYVDDPGHHVLCPGCGAVTVVDEWRAECECDECGRGWVPANGPVTSGGYYACPSCGQRAAITDAIAEQGRPDERLYAVEYYCEACDERGRDKREHRGYRRAEAADRRRFEAASREWEARTDLREYVPDEPIPEGATTVVRDGVNYDGHDLFDHGYERWVDLFNDRQLLCLSKLLRAIDSVPSTDARDYLLLAFSDALMFQSTFSIYNRLRNNAEGIFRMNGYVPQTDFVENNVWGAPFGRGTFRNTWEKVVAGLRYARGPTDRYVDDGETVESPRFDHPVGSGAEVYRGDMRELDAEDEYDAVITDPPYYDNVVYSELSDYFYVWQTLLLEDDYPGFDRDRTPRADSLVANPYLGKTAADFEHEMGEALAVIRRALKPDGTLAFTYHHSDSESWGELLESLCENGFEVTATYPINSDLNKFVEAREAVSFDIVIVARPTETRRPVSWRTLRRRIHRTAARTRDALADARDLTGGDVGVIEMGKCFQEYSPHHGEVRRGGERMSAAEVVDEIYGIVRRDERGERDVYLDLLAEEEPSYSDLNKHLKRSNASEETLAERRLCRTDGGDLVLGDWSDEPRLAYVRDAIGSGDPSDLDRAHFLRHRYERGRSRAEYLDRWDGDDLRELCADLAGATGDETYLRMLDASVADRSDDKT